MNAKEQKTEVLIQKPCFEFQDQPKIIVLCEKCGEIIGKTLFNPGQISETRSIFVRFKIENSRLILNSNVCGRRLLDLFASYCSKCEYEEFHRLNAESIKEMEKPKF
jgi:ribosomal protein L37E